MNKADETYDEEVDILEIVKILYNRRYLIIIPIILSVVVALLFLQLKPKKVVATAIINTNYLNSLISFVEGEEEIFSIVKYNYFIKPVQNDISRKEKYRVKIGKYDSIIRVPLKKQSVYNLVLTHEFNLKKKNIKKTFLKDIDSFIDYFERMMFREYYKKKKKESIDLQFDIQKEQERIKILDQKIKVVKKFLLEKNLNYVNILGDNKGFYYLPPHQQYIGLKTMKSFIKIDLKENVKKYNSLIKFFRLVKNNNISDFKECFLKDKNVLDEDLFIELESLVKKFEILREESKNNINFEVKKHSLYKVLIGVFFLAFFFFIMLAFMVEWWQRNKDIFNKK